MALPPGEWDSDGPALYPDEEPRGQEPYPRAAGEASGILDVDLYEDERAGEYVLLLQMPGYDPDSLDVKWLDGRLVVSANPLDEFSTKKRPFRQEFPLEGDIDVDGIDALYRSGILRIVLPMIADEDDSGTNIDVRT